MMDVRDLFKRGRHSALAEALGFHRFLLTDTGSRLTLFHEAIVRAVAEGDVVLDIGTGTGVLACFAVRAGARRVFAIDQGVIIDLAPALTRECTDRIEFSRETPRAFTPPEAADLIVMDMFNTCGLQNGALGALIDVRTRCLKAGGAVLPHTVRLFAAPVEVPDIYGDLVDCWTGETHGLRLSAARPFAVNQRYAVRLEPSAVVAEGALMWETELATVETAALAGRSSVVASRSGTAHGLCAWFAATLHQDLSLTNRPGLSNTNYAQAFFPFATPMAVRQGDRVQIDMSTFDAHEWCWQISISTGDGPPREAKHCTLWGTPNPSGPR